MKPEVAHYGQWFALPDGMVSLICCDCGLAHDIVWKPVQANMQMRFDRVQTYTDELREDRTPGQIPLYDEIVSLREDNKQLREQVAAEKETVKRAMKLLIDRLTVVEIAHLYERLGIGEEDGQTCAD